MDLAGPVPVCPSHTVNLLGNLPLQCLDVLLTLEPQEGSLEFLGVNMDVIRVLLGFLEKRLHQVGRGPPVGAAQWLWCPQQLWPQLLRSPRWRVGVSSVPRFRPPATRVQARRNSGSLPGEACAGRLTGCFPQGIKSSLCLSTWSLDLLGAPSPPLLLVIPDSAVTVQAALVDRRELSCDPHVLARGHAGRPGLSAALQELSARDPRSQARWAGPCAQPWRHRP